MFAGNSGVIFLLRSGKKVSFTFAEKPVITLSGTNLSVSVCGVECVNYSDDVVSAVDNVVGNDKSQHVVFSYSASTLNVSGLPANSQ